MTQHIKMVATFLLLLTAISCGSDRKLYYETDGSGTIFLSRYTSILPTLGPCGFSRASDDYEIEIPRRVGKIDCKELRILDHDTGMDTTKRKYAGFIAFTKPNSVYVELYKNINGKMVPLTINGTHRLKVKKDTIDP